jgi:two-component system, NarL family, sensor kinase
MFELDPPDMAPGGLAAALSALAGVEASLGGFAVEVEVTTGDLPDATRRLCYRTVREALTNVRRHAKATHVNVRVDRADGCVTGVITDDGEGFDIAVLHSDDRRLHLGLRALGARIEQTGGTWRIDSTPGQGSTLLFEVPVHSP